MANENNESAATIDDLAHMAGIALAHSKATGTVLQCLLMELIDHKMIDKAAAQQIFERAQLRFENAAHTTDKIAAEFLKQFQNAIARSKIDSDRH